jgi:hypothetical protein
MVLKAKVHAADLQDRAAVALALEGAAEEFPRLEHLWVDQGYTGTGKAWGRGTSRMERGSGQASAQAAGRVATTRRS